MLRAHCKSLLATVMLILIVPANAQETIRPHHFLRNDSGAAPSLPVDTLMQPGTGVRVSYAGNIVCSY